MNNDLNDRITGLTGHDLTKMSVRLGVLVEKRENAKARLDFMREMRKVTLDSAALDWAAQEERDTKKRPSEARAEREGRTAPSYKKYLEGIQEAHRVWGRLVSQASALDNEMWAARMAVSFAKAELSINQT